MTNSKTLAPRGGTSTNYYHLSTQHPPFSCNRRVLKARHTRTHARNAIFRDVSLKQTALQPRCSLIAPRHSSEYSSWSRSIANPLIIISSVCRTICRMKYSNRQLAPPQSIAIASSSITGEFGVEDLTPPSCKRPRVDMKSRHRRGSSSIEFSLISLSSSDS